MELNVADIVIEGLKHLNTNLNTDLSKKVMENTVKNVFNTDVSLLNSDVYLSKGDLIKQAEFAILSILVLATKYNYDSKMLREFLEGQNILKSTIDEIIIIYDNKRTDFIILNSLQGHSLPHITETNWRLTYDIKSSSSAITGEITFNINLGKIHQESGDRETIIEFVCNPEELQSFINKLKDIERHCEKLTI